MRKNGGFLVDLSVRGKTGPKLYKLSRSSSRYMVVWQAGEGKQRKYFKEERAAENFKADLMREVSWAENLAGVLSADDRLDYAEARRLLAGSTMRVSDVVRTWVSQNPCHSGAKKSIEDAIEDYTRAKLVAGRADRTLEAMRLEITAMAKMLKLSDVSEITPEKCEAWISAPGISQRTRINKWLRLSSFCNWLASPARRYIGTNPLRFLERPTPPASSNAPGTLDVDQVDAVLDAARVRGCLPAVAVLLLAGLRVSEARELPRNALREDYIAVIGIGKLKYRTRRLVPVCPRLRKLLPEILASKHPLTVSQRDKIFIHKLTGIRLTQNIFRHSYISYRLAETSNRALTAENAGNSPNVLARYYLDPKTPEDARRFFGHNIE